ncbi:hypothetical protein L6452_05337 [Arctium lappa]|uniref:Uncharacterized protein n=1 Tax=Arctium lappa TaxID=4217 RepID=A0ACB9EFP2_ARCLA|nr:hypothetical protein L6452_05337 [Arctium lappa]
MITNISENLFGFVLNPHVIMFYCCSPILDAYLLFHCALVFLSMLDGQCQLLILKEQVSLRCPFFSRLEKQQADALEKGKSKEDA